VKYSPQELDAVQAAAALERPLRAVEEQLVALGTALHRQDAAAVEHFTRAARHGAVPAPLRHRLALAGGQVAAQREALARATASLDRAIDVLIPRHAPKSFYSAAGANERHGGGGALLA
jgi:hypothetical protein